MAFRSFLTWRNSHYAVAAAAVGGATTSLVVRHHDSPPKHTAPWAAFPKLAFAKHAVGCEMNARSASVSQPSSRMKEIAAKVDIKQVIRKSKTFECIESSLLDAVCSVSQPIWLKKGTHLTEQGETNATMFVVCYGTLAVMVNDEQVAVLDAGNLIGEYSAIRADKAKATIKVTSATCYVASFAREDLIQALDEDSWAMLEWLVDEKSKEYIAHEFLRTVPIFAEASEEFFQHAAKLLTYRKYCKGATLLTAGESDDQGMFIVRTGEISASVADKLVKTIGPKGVIGEMMLVSPNAVRSATVRADTDVDLFQMRRSDFMQLLTKYPKDMLPLRKAARNAVKKKSTVRTVSG